jgi:UDP-2-acetamido-3-amino-2,3-dideoxy-glucuronate N-acetyltransferase
LGTLRGNVLDMADAYVHSTAVVDGPGTHVGADTKVWHFVHVTAGAWIGDRCVIGHCCYLGRVRVGHGCRIQNHVSIFDGVTLEDDVFCGPSCVFTNVKHPRAHVSRRDELARTIVCKGATIGASATILCGITIGEYAMIGAGAVVTRDVPPHALVVGTPARRVGWACRCGDTLGADLACERCGDHYVPDHDGLSLDPVSHTTIEDKTVDVIATKEDVTRAGKP